MGVVACTRHWNANYGSGKEVRLLCDSPPTALCFVPSLEHGWARKHNKFLSIVKVALQHIADPNRTTDLENERMRGKGKRYYLSTIAAYGFIINNTTKTRRFPFSRLFLVQHEVSIIFKSYIKCMHLLSAYFVRYIYTAAISTNFRLCKCVITSCLMCITTQRAKCRHCLWISTDNTNINKGNEHLFNIGVMNTVTRCTHTQERMHTSELKKYTSGNFVAWM